MLNKHHKRKEGMRTNLAVPFADKDAAKSLGARWDAARRVWYVENVDNLEQFLRWIPGAVSPSKPARTQASRLIVGQWYFDIKCKCLAWDPCEKCRQTVVDVGWPKLAA